MGWKQAVLSAGVSSKASKKRNIEQLKHLTIEERRQRILDAARKGTQVKQPVAQRKPLRKAALGCSRTNLLTNMMSSSKDIDYIPVAVDKKKASIRGTFVIQTENENGEYQDCSIISGYANFTGQTGSLPSFNGSIQKPRVNFPSNSVPHTTSPLAERTKQENLSRKNDSSSTFNTKRDMNIDKEDSPNDAQDITLIEKEEIAIISYANPISSITGSDSVSSDYDTKDMDNIEENNDSKKCDDENIAVISYANPISSVSSTNNIISDSPRNFITDSSSSTSNSFIERQSAGYIIEDNDTDKQSPISNISSGYTFEDNNTDIKSSLSSQSSISNISSGYTIDDSKSDIKSLSTTKSSGYTIGEISSRNIVKKKEDKVSSKLTKSKNRFSKSLSDRNPKQYSSNNLLSSIIQNSPEPIPRRNHSDMNDNNDIKKSLSFKQNLSDTSIIKESFTSKQNSTTKQSTPTIKKHKYRAVSKSCIYRKEDSSSSNETPIISDWCKNQPILRKESISLACLESSDEEYDDENNINSPKTKVPPKEIEIETWTERFQRTLENIRCLNADTPIDELVNGNAELLYLAQDFLHCAETYGRIIISERFLPVDEKTIKPLSMGGVAGGEKYVVHNTLFKFAVDSYGILGSDYAAAKVAGNELKGLICYFNTHITELRLPLMALVDYMGFRIIAMSLLPINNDTLVYGTNDGGILVHNSNLKLSKLMKEAAEMINIKKHICGLRTMSGMRLRGWQELYSPADLEGHVGKDGNFYLIDFARTLPPEAPIPGSKSAHLYQLLRPEFIKSYEEPLCSDAFSGFLMADPLVNVHNESVKNASEYLHKDLIPRFVRDSLVWQIREAQERKNLHEFPITEAIHAKGICMRHIGLIIKNIRNEPSFKSAKNLLILEATSRVLKNKLRGLLRRKMKEIKQPLEAPYRQLVIRFLNLVFGKSKESDKFWDTIVKKQLRSKFRLNNEITQDNNNYSISLKKIILIDMEDEYLSPCIMLFNRITNLMGLKFTPQVILKFTNPSTYPKILNERYPFDDTYLDQIGYKVKHMNIIAEALGSYYYYKGLRESLEGQDNNSSVELLRIGLEKFEEALGSNPTNTGLLKNAALCCTRIAELVASGGAHLEDIQFDPSAADIQKADQYYIRGISSDPDDGEYLYSYAKFLWRCGRYERAEEYFLQSLETNPNFVWCLRDYGVLLSEQGLEDTAEEFFVIASQRTNILSKSNP